MDSDILINIERWAKVNGVSVTSIEQDYSSVCFITGESSKFISGINGKVNMRSIKENLRVTPVSMSKAEIDAAIREYLESNGVQMLSGYTGIKSKISIVANAGFFKDIVGTVNAETLLTRMKAKKSFYPEMTNFEQDTRDAIIANKLAEFSAVPCEPYKGSEKPILFKITDGMYKDMYGTTTFSGIKRGSGWSFESLTKECKTKYFNEYAHSRGYEVLKLPKQLRKTNRAILLSPQGNKWDTVWNSFEGGRNCPSDTYTQSYGERLVHSVLNENGIDFKAEHCFTNRLGTTQFMDFLVEHNGVKYCIEYNGIQHYEEVEYFGRSLSDVQFLDKLKMEYCESNGIVYVGIPYQNDTPKKVFDVMSRHIDLESIPSNIVVNKTAVRETIDSNLVIEYYKNNSYRKTTHDLNIGKREFDNICKAHNFNKREWLNNGKNTLTGTR